MPDIREDELDVAVRMIKNSSRPFIFVGGGVTLSNASAELKEFVEQVDAPVCDTLMGKGAYDGTDERYTGMLGMHGTKASNLGVSRSDLVIAIGTRFSDRVFGNAERFAPHAKKLHIDIDAAEIDKNILVDASVIGDAKAVLSKLIERLEKQSNSEWMEEIKDLKETYPLRYENAVLPGPFVVEEICRQTHNDAIIVTEVGQHQMWAAQFYDYKRPRQFLSSGGLGTMGYGLGAAIGAQIANPDKQVVNIAGDGCFRMNMNEIATAVRNNLPLIEVVINNHALGMVRQWQNLFYEKRFSHTVLDDKTDYVKLAEAMGAKGIRATTKDEFTAAFKEALASGTPVLIECVIDSDDMVWPMVAPGKSIEEVFDAEDLKN